MLPQTTHIDLSQRATISEVLESIGTPLRSWLTRHIWFAVDLSLAGFWWHKPSCNGPLNAFCLLPYNLEAIDPSSTDLLWGLSSSLSTHRGLLLFLLSVLLLLILLMLLQLLLLFALNSRRSEPPALKAASRLPFVLRGSVPLGHRTGPIRFIANLQLALPLVSIAPSSHVWTPLLLFAVSNSIIALVAR